MKLGASSSAASSTRLKSSAANSASSKLALILQRRQYDLAQFPTPQWVESIQTYLDTQKTDGTWPDVNYASGCTAQRANWPIQLHWDRLITLAAAWTGLNPAIPSNWTHDTALLSATQKGMDWWFENDYNSTDCIGAGGSGSCPCGTPGLWNTNWFDQVILIPQLMSTTCLLMQDQLTDFELDGCIRIVSRPYDRSNGSIAGVGVLTGANLINVMQNSVSLGLYSNNASIIDDAFNRAFGSVTFSNAQAEDGIHQDGSFLQHKGILYNGNYGKDLINAFVQLEGEAKGTSYAANDSTRAAFATDIRGSEWMIFVDNSTGRQLWDFNVVGRFVAFPSSDNQANSDINFNVSKLANAVSDFEEPYSLNDTITRLESNGTEKLNGNKAFWASDYMVHRRDGFALGNKMLSNRSRNTEYTNGANPYGFHLGQGTLFTYISGEEYLDIMDAWDWNLIPGTTALLNFPTLGPENVDQSGKRDWVGVVSDGWVGTAVEDYLDPYDGSVAYKKMWFYLDDCVVIVTTDIQMKPNASSIVPSDTPLITVLNNQKATAGGVWIDGQQVEPDPSGTSYNGTTLYYSNNGYIALGNDTLSLVVAEGNRTGNWSAISTSTLGNTTVPIFSAYTIVPTTKTSSYALYPATSPDVLQYAAEYQPYTVIDNADGIIGVAGIERLSLVFWPGSAGNTTLDLGLIGWADQGQIQIASSQPGAYLFATGANDDDTYLVVTVADPSQSLESIEFSISSQALSVQCTLDAWYGCQSTPGGVAVNVTLPSRGRVGSSTFVQLNLL
ncbi:chondroitin AC/alginate lyase [Kockovaella imperatae]|uniref:Chondroitin AC/alginate lyase n=1 Tax=Kockovaella imperatae TaxID=4999 RepID=A0A1Y1UFC0_9TREE|nr:chondroitin AC/alginate lyase [Kockovaella imperatae]ORX36761.1 chondroitin AC/alginate lyase [Kockovaella imperatae]